MTLTASCHIPAVGVSFCLVALVFLPNRFDVPYALRYGNLDVHPTSLMTLVVFSGALILSCRFTAYGQIGTSSESLSAERFLGFRSSTFLFLWTVVGILSTIFNGVSWGYIGVGLLTLFTLVLWILPLYVIPILPFTRKEVHALLILFCLLAGLGAAITVFQSVAPHLAGFILGLHVAKVEGSEPRGSLPLGVATVVGAYYLMALPLTIALWNSVSSMSYRIYVTILVIVLILGCLFTASRSTIALTIACFMISILKIKPNSHSRDFSWPIILLFVSLLIGLFFSFNFTRIFSLWDGSLSWRVQGALTALDMIRDQPFVGHGIENIFHRFHGDYYSNLFSSTVIDGIMYESRLSPREPHNTYLLVGAETGLIGLSFFFLFLVAIVRKIWDSYQSVQDDLDRSLFRGILIGMGAVFLHCLTGSDLMARHRLSILFWIYMGLAFRMRYSEEE